MYQNRKQGSAPFIHAAMAMGLALLSLANTGYGQAAGLDYQVTDGSQRLEMVVNSSRILSMDRDIPRVLVNNRDIVRVTPLSPTQVQVSGLKAGVTQVNLWDKDGGVRSVDVIVYPDSRRLEMVLQAEFPNAAIRVRPLDNSVILAGHVDRPEVIGQVVAIAEDFYPKVINNMSVGGVQQVALHAKVMEVSRTKLRTLAADFAINSLGDQFISSAAGVIAAVADGTNIIGSGSETITLGLVDGSTSFQSFIEALRRNELVKILAEPTLVTVSGRPASFQEGGEFPIVVAQGIGANSVEFKQFGTRVDFVPIVLGNGNIRLEVRPQVSEIDNSRGVDLGGVVVPGLRTRWVDTAAEMRSGQTLALAGLIQTRVEASSRGLPWLADLPWTGALFRRNSDEMNEIELLVTVRPELVTALDPHQVPPTAPGQHTTQPNDVDFFGRGYLEVPRCCPDVRCTNAGGIPQQPAMGGIPMTNANPTNGYMNQMVEGAPVNSVPTPLPVNAQMPTPAAVNGGNFTQQSAPVPNNEYSTAPTMQMYNTSLPGGASSNPGPVNPGSGTKSAPSPSFGPSGYDNLDF